MNWDDFEDWSHKAASWGATYHKTLRDRPVRAQVAPGDTLAQLPASPPEAGQPLENTWDDFQSIVMPGITHWQHPRFFAYFNSNAAPASVLAEFLTSIVAPQCIDFFRHPKFVLAVHPHLRPHLRTHLCTQLRKQ